MSKKPIHFEIIVLKIFNRGKGAWHAQDFEFDSQHYPHCPTSPKERELIERF